jgi:hypothetical protein
MEQELKRLLSLYANHAEICGCFICRNLTDVQREALNAFWEDWGGRKSRTKNPYSPQNKIKFR